MSQSITRHDGTLRLLVVEDSLSDAKLAIWGLKDAGYNCSYRCVENEVQMRAALLAELPDLILSDFSLPKFDGMSALAVALAIAPDVPFIFLTGMVRRARHRSNEMRRDRLCPEEQPHAAWAGSEARA